MNTIRVIELSLRCFVYSLIGLIPLLGLPMSLLALACYRKQTGISGKEWNPARPYLVWGVVLGGLGSLLSCLVFGLILLALWQ